MSGIEPNPAKEVLTIIFLRLNNIRVIKHYVGNALVTEGLNHKYTTIFNMTDNISEDECSVFIRYGNLNIKVLIPKYVRMGHTLAPYDPIT